MKKLRTEISEKGQHFYDRPIRGVLAKTVPMVEAVTEAVGSGPQDIVGIHHYERVRLQWIDKHTLTEQERIDLSLGAHPNDP